MRTRHLSLRTEQAYLQWLRRYLVLHQRRHARELGARDVEQFLTHLAVERRVSAATQNQALQALLFLYRHVLDIELPWLNEITRASHARPLPVVLTRIEVRALLAQLEGAPWLVASLLYGSGLRLIEALRLRVKDPGCRAQGRPHPAGELPHAAAIALPRICSRTATTSARCRSCSVTRISRPR
jgi:integrase